MGPSSCWAQPLVTPWAGKMEPVKKMCLGKILNNVHWITSSLLVYLEIDFTVNICRIQSSFCEHELKKVLYSKVFKADH
jgi:hypothetical protein